MARFGLCILLTSLTFSCLAMPWVDLSWWSIFRRCVSIASALSLWFCVTKLERRSLRSYGFSANSRAGRRQLFFGLLLGLGTLGLLFSIGLISGACEIKITPDRVRLWRTVLGFIPAALLVSILEEMVFRGFILQHLLVWSKPMAIITSSALYAFVHLRTATLNLSAGLELGGLFLLGAVLGLSYLVTSQLYVAVGLHTALAYGARVNKLLIRFPDASLAWMVGTNRLVNGFASWVALLMIGGLVVWWARSPHGGGVDHGSA